MPGTCSAGVGSSPSSMSRHRAIASSRKSRCGKTQYRSSQDRVQHHVGDRRRLQPFGERSLEILACDLATSVTLGELSELLRPVALGLADASADPTRAQTAHTDRKLTGAQRQVEILAQSHHRVLARVVRGPRSCPGTPRRSTPCSRCVRHQT